MLSPSAVFRYDKALVRIVPLWARSLTGQELEKTSTKLQNQECDLKVFVSELSPDFMLDLWGPTLLLNPVLFGKAGQEIAKQVFVALSCAVTFEKDKIWIKNKLGSVRASANLPLGHRTHHRYVILARKNFRLNEGQVLPPTSWCSSIDWGYSLSMAITLKKLS